MAAARFGYDMIRSADTPVTAIEPGSAATLTAKATERARVALTVTSLVSRRPAISPDSNASIERLAEGRCVLGIGASNSGTRNLGMRNSNLKETERGIRQIKMLLAGEPVTLEDGGTAHIPRAAQAEAPKVFLAGSGPKTLALAGAVADGAFVNYGITADTMAQSIGRVQIGRAHV